MYNFKLAASISRMISIVGLSSLFVTVANAQLTFTIDTFTTDELTVTIAGGSTLTGTTPTNANFLIFAEASGTDAVTTDFASGFPSSSTPSFGTVSLGASAFSFGSFSGAFSVGTVPVLIFGTDLVAGSSFASDTTFSILGTGIFTPGNVSLEDIGLFWGNDASGTPTNFQSLAAVPEPSSYGILFGLFALAYGLVAKRRF